jgi:thioredoxin 1
MVITVTNKNHSDVIEKALKPVIVDVYATWCGPCMNMQEPFEQLSNELDDRYVFAKINVDDARDLAILYNVSSIPAFLFIKENRIIHKETGAMSKGDLKEIIEETFGI